MSNFMYFKTKYMKLDIFVYGRGSKKDWPILEIVDDIDNTVEVIS